MDKNNELIQAIRKGDRDTINYLYKEYFNSAAKYILSNNGTIDDTKDIFQDAIMILYKKCKDKSFNLTSSVHTYLFAIIKNIWLKRLRNKTSKAGNLPENLELIEEDNMDYEITWRAKEKLYKEKFNLLGEQCQKIISLFLHNVSMVEIAEKLDLSSAAYAKKKKYKCKLKLFALIQEDSKYKSLMK